MDMVKQTMAGVGGGNDSPTTDNNHTPSSSNDNKLYKGVRKRKWGKWVSEIRLPNSRERIWLGSYDSPEKAARAFDAALYCLRGRHASFNFPDTPFNLDINVAVAGEQSLTPQEIQDVAAKFANEEPPLVVVHNDDNQEPSSQPQRDGDDVNANSFGSKSKSLSVTASTYTTASSSSTTMCESDGTVQVDHGDMSSMDWTFLNGFDDNNEFLVGSNYYPYSEPDKIHSGELLYSTPPPPPFEDDNADQIEGDDPFSHQSFLWNWNF